MLKSYYYYLLPESGYTGNYIRKENHYFVKYGTVADMIHDSKMLWGSDFNKVIPDLEILNDILKKGYWGRLVEWEPFTLEKEDYLELIDILLSLPLAQPYRVIQPKARDITNKLKQIINGELTREEVGEWALMFIKNDDNIKVSDINAWHYLVSTSSVDEMIAPGKYLYSFQDIEEWIDENKDLSGS